MLFHIFKCFNESTKIANFSLDTLGDKSMTAMVNITSFEFPFEYNILRFLWLWLFEWDNTRSLFYWYQFNLISLQKLDHDKTALNQFKILFLRSHWLSKSVCVCVCVWLQVVSDFLKEFWEKFNKYWKNKPKLMTQVYVLLFLKKILERSSVKSFEVRYLGHQNFVNLTRFLQ